MKNSPLLISTLQSIADQLKRYNDTHESALKIRPRTEAELFKADKGEESLSSKRELHESLEDLSERRNSARTNS